MLVAKLCASAGPDSGPNLSVSLLAACGERAAGRLGGAIWGSLELSVVLVCTSSRAHLLDWLKSANFFKIRPALAGRPRGQLSTA